MKSGKAPRHPRRGFLRFSAIILVTGVITGLLAFMIGGYPSADAQPPPTAITPGAPAAGTAPAPAPAAVTEPWYQTLAKQPIDEAGNFWMPKAVNLEADSTDEMFYAVWALSAFFFLAITIAVVYLVVKYRHRPGHKSEPSASHNDALEITWTIIPTIISVFLFYYGWRTYVKVVTPPTKALEVYVVASKWEWSFTHPNGATDSNLHVPVGEPIRLVMTSTDVLHAFYAPVMRVKQDIIPKRYTYAWFLPTKPGVYRLTCAEYCGTNHSQMSCKAIDPETKQCLQRAVVVVHESMAKYEQYISERREEIDVRQDPEVLGGKIYKARCIGCHSIDGTRITGPTFKIDAANGTGWGTTRKMQDGGDATMNEDFVRESLQTPNKRVRVDYPASMTPFDTLKEKEIIAIIAFLKSLK